MSNESIDSEIRTTNRRYRGIATVVVIIAVLAAGFYLLWSARYTYNTTAGPAPVTASTTIEGPVMSIAEPVSLKIPAINVDASFSEPLGLEKSGEIEVPKDYVSVGYYKNGPTPGEIGPAVVLGHVDSVKGPAVFWSLGQLKEGDEVMIDRADGTTATFAVTAVEKNSQSDFPTEKVYGKINFAGLRLITCTGVYDHNKLRYSHNLIVYGKLVATSTKTS